MKKLFIITIILLTAGASIILLAGCGSTRIKRLSGEEFIEHAKACAWPGSFVWSTYIGVSDQNAYLEYAHPAFIGKGNQTTVYWTPLSELPGNLATQLKNGTPPWTNWNDNVANQRLGTIPEIPIDLSKP